VLFVTSIINPSGLVTAASVALISAGLRIVRGGESLRWAWLALVVSGAVVAISFQSGPAFPVVDLAAIAAVAGVSGLRALARRDRSWRA
jgi:hypothetical protein